LISPFILPLSAHAKFLGDLSANELNANSIFNDLGPYDTLSPTSPRNPIGVYGNPVSPYSETNPLAIEALTSPPENDDNSKVEYDTGFGGPRRKEWIDEAVTILRRADRLCGDQRQPRRQLR